MRHDGPAPTFADDFDGPDLDRSVWLPYYLPHWSSREASAATYEVGGALRLAISPDQGLWCADDHRPPMRVSGIQSGGFSGPAGSTIGQQPYREGLRVREAQPAFRGWTPAAPIRIEIRMRGTVSLRSMFAFWMVGFEERLEESAEICVAEIFGRSIVAGASAEVGMGVHRFRDPDAVEDWEAIRVPIDASAFHDYAVDWRRDRVDYLVNGELVRTTRKPPVYPMQMMIAVFDFPEWSTGADDDLVPELVVEHLRAWRAEAEGEGVR